MGFFTLPQGLAPELYPLAWLVGEWRGEGTVGYPGIDPMAIEQVVSFTHDGGPYLRYDTTAWRLDAEGERREAWHAESGFWRPVPGSAQPGEPASVEAPGATAVDVECLIADPAGFVTVYLGRADGPRIDLASDLVARTETAAEVSAASRMYGLVQSDLLWAWDIAAFGQPLQSYLAARLVRQDPEPDADDAPAVPDGGGGSPAATEAAPDDGPARPAGDA